MLYTMLIIEEEKSNKDVGIVDIDCEDGQKLLLTQTYILCYYLF